MEMNRKIFSSWLVGSCLFNFLFCDQDLGRGGGRVGGVRVKIGRNTFSFQIPRMELGRHTAWGSYILREFHLIYWCLTSTTTTTIIPISFNA